MKIRLERFSNLCLFEQIGAFRMPTSDGPLHIIHVSDGQNEVQNYKLRSENSKQSALEPQVPDERVRH